MAFIIFAFCVWAAAVSSPTKTKFTSLVSFDRTNGSNPYYESFVQGTDGNLYGTTTYGGVSDQNCDGESCGTIFKITPAGRLTTLHQFDFTDGGLPEAGLVQTTDGPYTGILNPGNSYSGYISGNTITQGGEVPPYIHDFGSILAYIEFNFLGRSGIGAINSQNSYDFADGHAPDATNGNIPLSDFFGLSTPRTFTVIPTSTAYPLSYFTNNPAGPAGPGDDGDGD